MDAIPTYILKGYKNKLAIYIQEDALKPVGDNTQNLNSNDMSIIAKAHAEHIQEYMQANYMLPAYIILSIGEAHKACVLSIAREKHVKLKNGKTIVVTTIFSPLEFLVPIVSKGQGNKLLKRNGNKYE